MLFGGRLITIMKGFDDVAVFWDYGILSPEPAELHQLTHIRSQRTVPSRLVLLVTLL